MRLGQFEVPEEFSPKLKSLLQNLKKFQYGGNAQYSYKRTIIEALDSLKTAGLNTYAALGVFSSVHCLTQADLDSAWKKGYNDLELWLKNNGDFDLLHNCHFLQVSDEPHFVELCRAARLQHRKDPEAFPSLKTVEEIWDKIKLVGANQHNLHDIEKLEAIADREVWILLWDLNLSGKTVAKEISRLAKCQRILTPSHAPFIHVLCQVSCPAANDKIKTSLANLDLKGEIFIGLNLESQHNIRTAFSGPLGKEVIDLCQNFYEKVMAGERKQPWLGSVGPFGFDNGGWLITTEINSPNNSLPLLWFKNPTLQSEESRDAYKPPFPRIPSTLSHKSLAPYDLDSLKDSGERWLKERIQNLTAHRVTYLFYEDPKTLSTMRAKPKMWERTNHSDYKIRLSEVSREEFDEIKHALKVNYSEHIKLQDILTIERIAEDTGSANFKVVVQATPTPKPFLFRVYKRIKDVEKINTLHSIAQHFLANDVLPNSKYRECLVPLKPETDSPQGCPRISGRDKNAYLALFRYADVTSHFTGQSVEELRSVASEFARFQAALRDLQHSRPDIKIDKRRIPYPNPQKRYLEIRKEVLDSKRIHNWYDIPYEIMLNSMDFLDRTAERLAQEMQQVDLGDATVAFFDFHPHNTLVEGQACVLIYDFEGCSLEPTQQASLAYALHRFTREWFIKGPMRGHPTRGHLQQATETFLNSYSETNGLVPDGFIERLPTLILWENFQKLLGIYDKVTGREDDDSARTPRTYLKELKKFVMYLQEAEHYSF